MTRIFNFAAGPSAMPLAVLEKARTEMLDFQGQGVSMMELSHRSSQFVEHTQGIEANIRRLASIPEDYAILFLQGGGSQQFVEIPMNLASVGASADYLVTGQWSDKAVKAAQTYVNTRVVASTKDTGFCSLPQDVRIHEDAAFAYYTANETINGVEFPQPPACPSNVPLVADMSSNIFSKPLDITPFGLIYAGAQKNLGPAGVVMVIVKRELLARKGLDKASIFSYQAHAEKASMLNTPNTWAWYMVGLMIEWLIAQGGLEAMAENNMRKSCMLYDAIDNSGGFYHNPVAVSARSRMNIPFRLHTSDLESKFLSEAHAAGMIGLKGHRSVGGMRASLYNAVAPQAVSALVSFMRDFAQRHG